MPGAYTATPIVTTPPDVPDGWDPDWDFPGPNPPGYTPEYSVNLSATASISYDGAATATATLRDHGTYATVEPSGSSINWTATIDGDALGVRFSGDEDYESSISSSYSEGATYWGAAPEIEFELTEGNIGDTVVLTSSSTVSGESLTDTAEIEVNLATIYGHAYTYGPVAAQGATMTLYIDMVESGTTETDSDGLWEFDLELDDVIGTLLIVTGDLGDYAQQFIFADAITEGGSFEQDDINFPPIYTGFLTIAASCSENPLTLDTAKGMVYDDWAGSKEVGFTWTSGGDWVTDASGSAYFQMVEITDKTGSVTLDEGDYGSLVGETLTLYAYARGDDGQVATVDATFNLYRDGVQIDTATKQITATVPVGAVIYDAEMFDWLLIGASSITEL